MRPNETIAIQTAILGVGLSLSLFNTFWAINYLLKNPNRYNKVFIACNVLWLSHMLLSVLLWLSFYFTKTGDLGVVKFRAAVYLIRYFCEYAGILLYVLFIQFRFRAIKCVFPYKDIYDRLLLIFTIILWSPNGLIGPFFMLRGGMIEFIFGSSKDGVDVSKMRSPRVTRFLDFLFYSEIVWLVYQILIDNMLGYYFMRKISHAVSGRPGAFRLLPPLRRPPPLSTWKPMEKFIALWFLVSSTYIGLQLGRLMTHEPLQFRLKENPVGYFLEGLAGIFGSLQ
ncbi:hypothetical protein HK102_004264, partial [Quaeritorhiza haematococci]